MPDQHQRMSQLLTLLAVNQVKPHPVVLTRLTELWAEEDQCPSTSFETRWRMCAYAIVMMSNVMDELPPEFLAYCQRELVRPDGCRDANSARDLFCRELKVLGREYPELADWMVDGPDGVALAECQVRKLLSPPALVAAIEQMGAIIPE